MVSFTALLSVFVSLGHVALGQTVKPEQFPLDCKAELANAKPSLELGAVQVLRGTVLGCFPLGGKCTSDNDCGRPSRKKCQAEFPGVKNMVPGLGKCFKGFCRQIRKEVGEACDCLSGCSDVSDNSLPLSCANGICTEPPCAGCGEAPNGLRCCGSGVVDRDGKCFCGRFGGGGCVLGNFQCQGGTKCCNGGPFDNKCCAQCSDPTKPCK